MGSISPAVLAAALVTLASVGGCSSGDHVIAKAPAQNINSQILR